jgi:NADH-quinone oxidoreductase subunit J
VNELVLFLFFGSVALVGGVNVLFQRHPVHAALFLVASFLGIAGLFLTLGASFLAAIQVLVYAGAIMVLFLFLILLLNLDKEPFEGINATRGASALVAAATMGLIVQPLASTDEPALHEPARPLIESASASPIHVGQFLFREYIVPFEIISLLLLVAMVGAIHMARRPTPAELH